MRTDMQNLMEYRRGGKPKIDTPEALIRAFEARHGDRALPYLVRCAAEEFGPIFTHERNLYRKAIRILIHRAVGQARVAREVCRQTAPTSGAWVSARVDRYTPGYWTGD